MRFAVFVVSVFMLFGCVPPGPPPTAPSAILDKPLPKLSGRTVDGKKVQPEELANRVVVIKFFAKYCEPCKKTLPAAQRLHVDNDDVQFIGVAEDEFGADVSEMIKTYGLTFPVIHDKSNVVAGRFRVDQLPATFVTDTKGNVRWVGAPGQTEADLEAAIAWAKNPGK